MIKITEQYKMILKLASNNLLCHEKVLNCILLSHYSRNWETYLGCIIDSMKANYYEFIDLWKQSHGSNKMLRLMEQSNTEDWSHAKKLLHIILFGKKYISGEVL